MWPFKHKLEPGELDPDHLGLTPEEQLSVKAAFLTFTTPDGGRIGMEPHSPEITRGLVALGLWNSAEQKMEAAEFYAHTPDRMTRDVMLDRAVHAIKCAYSMHHLPIYLFDQARYLEARGLLGPARDMYRQFMLLQAHYAPGTYDDLFLRGRDVDTAIHETEDSLARLRTAMINHSMQPNLPGGQPYQRR